MIAITKKTSLAHYLMTPMIPILMYGLPKLCGQKYNNLEFIWWIYIPLAIVVYFFLTFKITKTKFEIRKSK